MRDFLERLQWKIQTFMEPRYGQDALSFVMTESALALLLITVFWKQTPLFSIALTLVAISLFRTFSKNIAARRQELAAFEEMAEKVKKAVAFQKRKWDDRKTYRYFKCKCGKVLRVPKGAGKIEITCPICGNRFIKKV